MTEKQLATYLSELVRRQSGWSVEFDSLVVYSFPNYGTLEWSDSGVGEEYVLSAFEKEWPGIKADIETEGGCGSCGYGRTVTLTVYGPLPWVQS